jgi:hypothetical protein|nr:MAG TPA: hypothetical protein [Caudoviricetes sp.]
MDRNQAKEFYPILQAFAEGRVIECRTKPSAVKGTDVPNDWTEMTEIEFWNNTEYRVKPEPKCRPFKDEKECWAEMQKHQPFGWTYDYTNNIWDSITRVTSSGIIYEEDMMCFEDVFNRVKFADGTPFGIKVEE